MAFTLLDGSAQTWSVSVNDSGMITATAIAGSGPTFVLINDYVTSLTFQLSILHTGFLVLTPAITQSAPVTFLETSPGGFLFLIRVFNGLLQTFQALTILSGGPFVDVRGNPVSNGTLLMQLPQDGRVTANTGQVTAGVMLTIPLDVNGNISGTIALVPTTALSPTGLQYTCWVQNSGGAQVWGPHKESVSNGVFNIAQNWTTPLP
jgi:hypothetical protein